MGLLKFRWKFDLLHNRKSEHILSSDFDLAKYNEDIICLYADLDKLLKRANLSERQWEIINLYMDGYVEREIAYELNDDVRNIIGTINSVCKKVCELNYESWKYDFIIGIKFKVKTNYKQCTKCKEYLPATGEYFSPNKQFKEGFFPYCKKCNAERMRN